MSTIFITGAASGIGRAAAHKFHHAGWTVGLVDVNESALNAVASELGDVWHEVLDVRDAAAVRGCIHRFTAATGGELNLVFNCAGVLRTGPFEQLSADEHGLQIDINVKGVINVLLGAFDALKTTPGALVVQMSSASALYGTPDFATYSASKFAVRALTEALDVEWEKHDIKVVDLMPPFVRGPMVDANPSPVMDRLGVNLQPEEIADVLFRVANQRRRSTHNPISAQFKALWLASGVIPLSATRQIMRFLSR